MSESTISIELNGQSMEIPSGSSIADLLVLAEIRSQLVAVEINREIVPKESHSTRVLMHGDVIEAVTLVGGG